LGEEKGWSSRAWRRQLPWWTGSSIVGGGGGIERTLVDSHTVQPIDTGPLTRLRPWQICPGGSTRANSFLGYGEIAPGWIPQQRVHRWLSALASVWASYENLMNGWFVAGWEERRIYGKEISLLDADAQVLLQRGRQDACMVVVLENQTLLQHVEKESKDSASQGQRDSG
jgi:hypothetical protein